MQLIEQEWFINTHNFPSIFIETKYGEILCSIPKNHPELAQPIAAVPLLLKACKVVYDDLITMRMELADPQAEEIAEYANTLLKAIAHAENKA